MELWITQLFNGISYGTLLFLTTPRPPTPLSAYSHLIDRIAVRRREDFERSMAMMAARKPPKPQEPDEFQQHLMSAWKELVRRGLPADQPQVYSCC